MLKKKLSKITSITFIAAVVVTSIFSINAYASNDNIAFEFKIGSWQSNGRVSDAKARLRETTNVDDQWKVGLKSSGEGTGTITRFWLEVYNKDNVSPAVNATQGSSVYYKKANSGASRAYVYLTGENNNFNGNTYYVSGIWDEETGVIAK